MTLEAGNRFTNEALAAFAEANSASFEFTPDGTPVMVFNQPPLPLPPRTRDEIAVINNLTTESISSLLDYPMQPNLTYASIPDVLSGFTLIRRALENQTVTITQILRHIRGIKDTSLRVVANNIHTLIYNGGMDRDIETVEFAIALQNASKVLVPSELNMKERNGANRYVNTKVEIKLFGVSLKSLSNPKTPSKLARASRAAGILTVPEQIFKPKLGEIIKEMQEKKWIRDKSSHSTFKRYIRMMVNKRKHSGCLSRKKGARYKQVFNPIGSLQIDHGPIKPNDITRELLYPNSIVLNEETGNIPGCSDCPLNKGCGQLATFHYTVLGRVKDYYKQYEEDSRAVVLALLNGDIAIGQEA